MQLKVKESLDYFMEQYRNLEYTIRTMRYKPLAFTTDPVHLFSDTLDANVFMEAFQSLIWLTYRHSFPPIIDGVTSDAGWGCMLRSGQMLLANALQRIQPDVIHLFLDNHSALYSIHKLALLGNECDKKVGEWFGPSTISVCIRKLVNTQPHGLYVVVAQDQQLVSTDIVEYPCLVLVPMRLGVDLNAVYYPYIIWCLENAYSVGIAGGRPQSSLYFCGHQENNLVYLDPHYQQPSLPLRDPHAFTKSDFASYHCDKPQIMALKDMDPSMVAGFLFKQPSDFEDFCKTNPITRGPYPLFQIVDQLNQTDLDVLTDTSELE
ncbi:hypothetical protein EDD86DRAFT_204506 [Gorgonomyces haynaldii]|nr:hypothetical protein EDD86DRAFT_204506 [Gorgonomyces haynaldii]